MLSRVAENLYWFGRYVERAENTARIVGVNANLLLDLPKGIAPGWEPLIAITGDREEYDALYADYSERHVVRFLLADTRNPSSMLASLAWARENARTMRDILPREVWEQVNELYLFARGEMASGVGKRGRYAYLKRIILGAQTLTGMLAGTMSHDVGYEFLCAGRNLERADMTSRIIDVRSATLLPDETTGLRPFENIQWMSVLKSLSGYQMYRQHIKVRVRRADVIRFLLQNHQFPRSVRHGVVRVEASMRVLPRNEGPTRALGRLKRMIDHADASGLAESGLHEFMDQVQLALAQVHEEVARTYFLVDPSATASAAA